MSVAALAARFLDPAGEQRIDGDAAIGGEIKKALRQIDIAGGERGADFALGDALIEGDALERPVAHRDRIVGRGQLLRGIEGAARERQCRNPEDCGAEERA